MTVRGAALPTGPRSISLIRHAEKPQEPQEGHHAAATSGWAVAGVDENGAVDRHSLTPRGWQRAGALGVAFCADRAARVDGAVPVPTVLISPDYGSAQENARRRTHQTIRPLSDRLGIPISSPVAKGEEQRLVEEHLLVAADAHVLVCWEHSHLPLLLAAIAARVPVLPTPDGAALWPDERFDVTLVLTRQGAAGAVRFELRQVPQLLLAGDSPDPLF